MTAVRWDAARRAGRVTALLLAALALHSLELRAQSRVAFAELELAGPATELRVDAGRPGFAHVAARLGPGESARVLVPVPVEPGLEPTPPVLVFATGTARFLGWRAREARFAGLPAALRARPAPLSGAPRVRAPAAVLLALAAAGALGLWRMRAPRTAAVLALCAAAGAFLLARGALSRAAAPIEVLDGVSGSSDWQRQRAALGELVLPARGATFDLVTDPPRARVEIEAPLDPASPARARARGASLVAIWAEPWPGAGLEREANELLPLAAAWLRADGAWTFHGPWDVGAPLGPARSGPPPPGWLVSGLPQGVTLVVGEVAGAARSWVRCTWP
ncbi:MAG: hypothetical protein JNK02_02730 [Planctomycetes bacterium]|nr:hypothetical protein [Planctomycetota bacterium]